MQKPLFKFIDLFAGIGGFKMAFNANGGDCIGFSEVNKDAIEVYCENYQVSPLLNHGDIRQIKELPAHDLLSAGVPCQSWSIAGKNLGFDDDRGQLWNDTIFLLNQAKPKAFIFENVKGLVDPRNKTALSYILKRIRQAGYYANYYVINSHDYGVAQNRVRIYIIGFRDKQFFDKFRQPKRVEQKTVLANILNIKLPNIEIENVQTDLFGFTQPSTQQMSLSSKNGFNDYFLFNDLRNGETTIHSWDIQYTTSREKAVCLLLLRNRRKKKFGLLDGNPLSLQQLKELDSKVSLEELESLVNKDILKRVYYKFQVLDFDINNLNDDEIEIIQSAMNGILQLDILKTKIKTHLRSGALAKTLDSLSSRGIIECIEDRYEFKNTKISSGINGINRIFLPTSDVFPTLVASDTNDFVATKYLYPKCNESYREKFLQEVYFSKNYRKITKEEACVIQGFPKDFKLPESRARWMKLIGNSVSVPVIDALIKSVIETGVFNE